MKKLDLDNPLHVLIALGGICLISLVFVGGILGLTFLTQHFIK